MNEGCTRDAVVTRPLHVERTEVQGYMLYKLEQLVSQSGHHHVILGVQFSGTAKQTTQQRVNSTWK